MTPRVPDEQLDFARGLRAQMTAAETVMWRILRDRRIGAKFRRQCPIGPYVADFACVAARLVVEIDGRSHGGPERRQHDRERDAWFAAQGWRVVRFDDDDVLAGGDVVMIRIKKELSRLPSSDPR